MDNDIKEMLYRIDPKLKSEWFAEEFRKHLAGMDNEMISVLNSWAGHSPQLPPEDPAYDSIAAAMRIAVFQEYNQRMDDAYSAMLESGFIH